MFAAAKARKWGDSLAVVIPRETVREENLSPGDDVEIIIRRKQKLADFFGILKTKVSAQEMKDDARKGWE